MFFLGFWFFFGGKGDSGHKIGIQGSEGECVVKNALFFHESQAA